ncbi:hypothetical protein WJX79_002742 [Trebouxia sp. C0005]
MRFSPVYAPEKHAGTDDAKRDNSDNQSSKAVSDNVPSPINPTTCLDEDRSCVTWAAQGECLSNPAFMLKTCKQACGVCQHAVPVGHQVRLSNGIMMPSVGFGTAGLGEHTDQAVKEALLAGYALIDTAQAPECAVEPKLICHANIEVFKLTLQRCWAELCGSTMPEGSWQDSWRALEQLVASGQLASIGVRNFDLSELSELWPDG